MQEFTAKFIGSIPRTQNVKSFRFYKPENFIFEVGQFVQVIFDQEDRQNKELNKMLSLSCCPDKEYIEVTKKLSESNFSKALLKLQEGDEILFKGAMGKCTYGTLSDNVCFLVGGIGITPVFPMLEYATAEGANKDLTLVYGNWTQKDIAFKKEIEQLMEKNSRIRLINVLAETDTEDETTIKGMINKEGIQTRVENYLQKDFFIFGPPKMVQIMQSLCEEIGINKEKIKVESFLGY